MKQLPGAQVSWTVLARGVCPMAVWAQLTVRLFPVTHKPKADCSSGDKWFNEPRQQADAVQRVSQSFKESSCCLTYKT